jgi:hypothetical protein
MKLAATILLCAAGMTAQTNSQSPLISTSQTFFSVAKNDILKSADKIPENLWSFRPTPAVRTVAQLFAHIADGQYEFCSAAEGKPVDKGIEKTAKTRTEIVAAVKEAFAYCDSDVLRPSDGPHRGDGLQYRAHHGALRQSGDLYAHQRDCAAFE